MGREMKKVITLDGKIINLGPWDYQVYQVDVVGNPFPGPMAAPDDWDHQIYQQDVVGNPLPDGATEEDLDVFFDRQGVLRLVRDAEAMELESRIASANAELSELLIDIQLGMANPEDVERAKELRTFLKENPLP